MLSSRLKRVAVITAISGALLAGASVAPATADPADEAIYLAAMKEAWTHQPAKTQTTTCVAYRVAPKQLVSQSLTATLKDPASKAALSKAEWRRVITAYLAWACSGPGTTPR